jgi:hypothetical protein
MATVSFKLSAADLKRIPAKNREAFLRAAVREKLERQGIYRWKPKTVLKLQALSEKHITGAKLLSLEEVREEIRERHGGLAWR